MKPFCWLLFYLALCASALATDIDVKIVGFKNAHGQAIIRIFSNQETFLKVPMATAVARIDASTLSVHVLIKGVNPGEAAIAVFHDVNGNGTLDRNFLNMPTEPTGFSNQAKSHFGPPSFEGARMNVEGPMVRMEIMIQ